MARSSDEFLPRLLWPSTGMLMRRNKGSFSARPPSSFSASPRAAHGLDGTSAGPPTATFGSGLISHIMQDVPKQPEMPRGILGVSSVSGARRTSSKPASANATPAAMDLQRRGVQASRQPQPPFPAMAPPVGVSQRKKNWRPHCKHPTCLRPASYAETSDSDPVFCHKHKTSGQQNVVHPNRGECEHDGCRRVSAYASTADTRARFCHLHKDDGMVKVRDNVGTRCEEETCIKQASFAMEGDRYPKFCKDHRKEDMINIRNHRCIAPGCSRGASFAVSGSRGQFCGKHKAAGMINTRRRNRCVAPGCTSREPIYVIEGQHIPKFCANHGGAGMTLPYPTSTSTPRGECMLQGCDRALEPVAPGEAQQRLCAAHNREQQQQQQQQEPPARGPRITDEAARPDGNFAAPNGSSRADAANNLAHRRDKTEAGQETLPAPVKREMTMTMAMLGSCSPGAKGGASPPRQPERITGSPGQLGGIVTLDFNRHRVPPRSPAAARANSGTSAPAPSPTAAWRMAAAGGRGSSSSSTSEVLGREKQATAATAAQATAPPPPLPPPHVYQALRSVGGGSGDPAAAAATGLGVGVARPSTPSTFAGDGGGVLSGESDKDSDAIAMGEEKCKSRASRGFGSVFPAYTTTSGSHLGFRAPSEFFMDGSGRRPLVGSRSPTDAAAGGAARNVGRRHQHQHFSQEREQEQEREHEQEQQCRRRPVVRLLHMDDPTGAARLIPPSDSSVEAASPPASPAGAGAAFQPPVVATTPPPTPPPVTGDAVNKEIETDRGEPREHGGVKGAKITAEAGREREEGEEGGAAIAIELRPPQVGGGGGGGVERGSATDSTVDATTTTTTEDDEGHEDLNPDRMDKPSAAAVVATASIVAGKKEKRRAAKPVRVGGTLEETQPPGYTPTPFYFTLVKALTGAGTATGERSVSGKRKRLDN